MSAKARNPFRYHLMSYKLSFKKTALKEWKKLSADLREQFKLKLSKRLETPRVPKDALSGAKDCYKIKLRNAGYRLVYHVDDEQKMVEIYIVGKREKSDVYKKLSKRLDK